MTAHSQILNKISERFGKELDPNLIRDVIDILHNHIEQEVLECKPIVVNNFGTLAVRKVSGHMAVDFITRELRMTNHFLTIKFHPSLEFMRILVGRRDGELGSQTKIDLDWVSEEPDEKKP